MMGRINWVVLLTGMLLAVGCKQEEQGSKAPEKKKEVPTASTSAVLNPEIANAMAKAAKGGASAPSQEEGAPPANGVLGPERAAKEAPPGAAATLKVASSGSGPKLLLGGPHLPAELPGQMTVSARTGPSRALPTIAFQLGLVGAAPEGGGQDVTAMVTSAKLAADQPGAIPPQLEQLVATLAGSSFKYRTVASSPVGTPVVQIGEKADKNLLTALEAASDALSAVLTVFPKQPVGVGAIWMVTNREKLSLGEMVGYHMFKAESLQGDRLTVSVKSKRYLINPTIQDLPILQFQGEGNSDLVFVAGHRLPVEGRTEVALQALAQGQGGAPAPVQWQLRALFSFPPAPGAVPSAAPTASAPSTSP